MLLICVSTFQVRYVCSADGCKLTEDDEHNVQDSEVLVLKRTQQTIRAVDQRSGAERYGNIIIFLCTLEY